MSQDPSGGALDVLIVEDSPVDARLLASLVRANRREHRVHEGSDLKSALELLEQVDYDVILLDLTLPDSQGLETLGAIRAADQETPIVVVTGMEDVRMTTAALQSGAQDYLVKHRLDPSLLARSMSYAIERARYERERSMLVRDLRERVKELSALHHAARLLQEDDRPGEQLLQEIVALLPGSFLHPEVASARIDIDELTAETDGFAPSPWCLEQRFIGNDDTGCITVCYSEERPDEDIGPFLADEQRLLQSLAQMLEIYFARRADREARQNRERQLHAIASVAFRLRSVSTRSDMATAVLEELTDLFALDGSAIVTTPARHERRIEGATGILTDRVLDFDPDGELTRRVVDSGASDAVTISFNGHSDVQLLGIPVATYETGANGAMLAPLGVLWAARTEPFDDAERELISAITDIVANGLHRAGLLDSLEHRVAERTQELAEANARLKELDRLKSKFVSDVSHELRTPVTNLTLYLSLLERGKSEKREHYLQVLRGQAARLARLIEDILDLSRLETGATQLRFSRVDVNQVVAEAAASQHPQISGAGLDMTVTLDENVSMIEADAGQLSQVITNLLSNAANYTTAGGIVVRTGVQSGRVFIEVEDTGMGIRPDELPHIFDRFYRGSGASQTDTPGSGLGLAIAREIVERHGGTIVVQSEAGVGTRIRVNLPTKQIGRTAAEHADGMPA